MYTFLCIWPDCPKCSLWKKMGHSYVKNVPKDMVQHATLCSLAQSCYINICEISMAFAHNTYIAKRIRVQALNIHTCTIKFKLSHFWSTIPDRELLSYDRGSNEWRIVLPGRAFVFKCSYARLSNSLETTYYSTSYLKTQDCDHNFLYMKTVSPECIAVFAVIFMYGIEQGINFT